MLGLTYSTKHALTLEKHAVPSIIDQTDAIVRVAYASICNSDLHIRDGFVPRARLGTILGHEYVGVIEEVGSQVTKFRPGDRVAASCLTMCGRCWFCKHKYFNNCESGGWLLGCCVDGGLAPFVRVLHADSSLSSIPDKLSFQDCLFVGDILATGYFGASMCQIQPGDRICVLGAGSCGLCAAMCATRIFRAECIIVEPDQQRRDFAATLGFGQVIAPDDAELLVQADLKSKAARNGFDAVIECAGAKTSLDLAIRLCRCHGIIAIVAMYEDPQSLDLPEYYGKNLTFKTGGVDAGYGDELIRLLGDRTLDCAWMAQKEYPFTQIMQALEDFEAKKHLKVVIRMDQ